MIWRLALAAFLALCLCAAGSQPRAQFNGCSAGFCSGVIASGVSVQFDAKVTADVTANAAITITNNFLTIGTGTLLVADIHWGKTSNAPLPTSPSCSWNSVGMTLVPGSSIDDALSNASMVALYYQVNPTTGNHALTCSWTGTYDVYLAAASFINANLGGGASTFPSIVTNSNSGSATASVTLSLASGDATYAAFTTPNLFSAVNGTQIFRDNSAAVPAGAAAYSVAGISPMTATLGSSNSWVASGVEIAHQ